MKRHHLRPTPDGYSKGGGLVVDACHEPEFSMARDHVANERLLKRIFLRVDPQLCKVLVQQSVQRGPI